MTHHHAVTTIKTLAPRFQKEGVADTLVKYAKANDLSPAQLEKLGQTYNTISALSTYEKSKDRGATAHSVDVPAMVMTYVDKPFTKSAAAMQAPTHDDGEVDLFKLFQHSLREDENESPEASVKEESEDSAEEDEQSDETPELEELQSAAGEISDDIDLKSIDLLRHLKKQAGVFDLSGAEEDALHQVRPHFIDAALRRIASHAAALPVPAQVARRRNAPLEKRAFVFTSSAGERLIDIARDMALLDKINRMIKAAATPHKRPKDTLHPTSVDRKPVDDTDGGWQGGGGGARLLDDDDDGGVQVETKTDVDTIPNIPPVLHDDEDEPTEEVDPMLALLMGNQQAVDPAPSGGGANPPPPPPPPGGKASDVSVEGEDVELEDTETDDRPRTKRKEQPEDKKTRSASGSPAAPEDKKTRSASGSPAAPDDPGMSAKLRELLEGAVALPADIGRGALHAISNSTAQGKAMLQQLTSQPRQNHAQAHADMSIEDIRRSFYLRRILTTDPVLSQADPSKVVKYYNILERANPGLAADPDAIKLVLREAVAYDGLPVETIKSLTATRHDAARAESVERDLRDKIYKI